MINDFALSTCVSWSKNVSEERQCPDQIRLGAHDDTHCILIALALHLESLLELHPEAKYLFTSQTDKGAPNKLKERYRRSLRTAAWLKQEFKDLSDDGQEGDIGTHSKRKMPATYAVNCGCVKNFMLSMAGELV